jgi:hypothetical protein
MTINITSPGGSINCLAENSINHTATVGITQTAAAKIQHIAPLINHLAMIKNLNPGAASSIQSLPLLSANLTSLTGQFQGFLGAGGFLTQLGSLTSAFGQLQTIAGSFSSITSIAQATAAFGQLNGILSGINGGLLPGFTGTFGSISGALGNLTSLSNTFSSLTNISSLSSITGSLNGLAGISSLSGLSSISSITTSLNSIQNLTNAVNIQTGFFNPSGLLSDATTLLSNINDTLVESPFVDNLNSQSLTLNGTLETVQPDLDAVNTALEGFS